MAYTQQLVIHENYTPTRLYDDLLRQADQIGGRDAVVRLARALGRLSDAKGGGGLYNWALLCEYRLFGHTPEEFVRGALHIAREFNNADQ